ncbi:MAG TPA: DUF1684 domain-containing protein [Aggregatilineales bacterium]|nr:DUF1684 domain-containing protein [Aggregatilineales bacterium]
MQKEPAQDYETQIASWRNKLDDQLRREDGWLTLIGLHWLQDGMNTVGSDPSSTVVLPKNSAPKQVGTIELRDGKAILTVTCEEPVTVDGVEVKTAELRHDNAEGGPSVIALRSLSFFLIKREAHYGIRVRDRNNSARTTFQGRKWFPVKPQYRIKAKFIRYETMRTLTVMNTVGLLVPMDNPGYVEFELDGQKLRLEAFADEEKSLWLIFKDLSNGKTTYDAGRFLVAPINEDGTVDLDFNRIYNPPCAFTVFATCPLPPKENILAVALESGEQLYKSHRTM